MSIDDNEASLLCSTQGTLSFFFLYPTSWPSFSCVNLLFVEVFLCGSLPFPPFLSFDKEERREVEDGGEEESRETGRSRYC